MGSASSIKLRVAVLISGRGSNLQALIDACNSADYPAKIICVISNKADAYGLERAKIAKIPTKIVNHKDFANREEFDAALDKALRECKAEFVCLAGFMRLLTGGFVRKWLGRIINIHPSLLPDFKGAHPHEDVIKSGAKKSGCTVHFVTENMDSGPTILQESVDILSGDTAETLAARVLKKEHTCYPAALRLIAEGKVSFKK